MPRPSKLVARDAAEVANARQGGGQQTIQELPHAVAAQGDLAADSLALADMEASDGLLGAGDARLLTGDDAHILDGGIELLGIRCSSADTHVDDDLLKLRNKVDVLDVKIASQAWR